VPKSYSSAQKMQQVFLIAMKKIRKFWISFFVGDIISGVGFWPFCLRLPGRTPTARWNFLIQIFVGNWARIRIF